MTLANRELHEQAIAKAVIFRRPYTQLRTPHPALTHFAYKLEPAK